MSPIKFLCLLLLSFSLVGCSTLAVSPGNTDSDGNLKVSLPNQTSPDNAFIVTGNEIHSHIHLGKMWGYSDTHHFAANGDTVSYMGCTAHNITAQFVDFTLVATAGPILIELYEDPFNITNNGTSKGNGNLNRQVIYNSTTKIYKDPTLTNEGTLLYTTIASGTKQMANLGSIPTEWILRNGTCYIYKITNNDGSDVDIYPTFLWYEDPLNN